MPTAVLFDVGNVIVRWDPRNLYAKIFSDPAELDAFLGQVCTMEWHTRHDAGVTMADNARALIGRFPLYEQQILDWNRRWDEMFGGIIAETEQIIFDLKDRGVPLYALTNMPSEKAAGVFAMSPCFKCFDDIIVSGDEGLVKPDPAIFHLTCTRANLAPQDFVFVDDIQKNIDAAEVLGMTGHLFKDESGLRPHLAALGLL